MQTKQPLVPPLDGLPAFQPLAMICHGSGWVLKYEGNELPGATIRAPFVVIHTGYASSMPQFPVVDTG